MAQKILTDEECIKTAQLVAQYGSQKKAAEATGIPRSTIQHQVNIFKARGLSTAPPVEMPDFPDDDISTEEIIDLACRRFEKRHAHRKAKQWFPVKINDDRPIALTFVGDPHVDDDGCNWPLLKHHCEILKDTEGMYAVNIGDSTNNWTGRLRTLFANQEMSHSTAWKLAKWLLLESGVKWLVWLLGNHDMWNDGSEIFRQMGAHIVEMRREKFPDAQMEEWQAQFKLIFPNGKECPVWAAHNFPGHSQWNPLHGLQKAAHTKAACAIYAAGHHHNWAMHQEESASRDFVYWLVRSRGYKFIDHYAEMHGHFPQQEGASVTAIIDPDAKSEAGFVRCEADVEAAADYLTFLRKQRA